MIKFNNIYIADKKKYFFSSTKHFFKMFISVQIIGTFIQKC